jgi:transcriptional regulator with XRE-family HTH domain
MPAGALLRHARRRGGLSQRELAKRTGVPQPAIARIESGHSVPRTDTLERLLRGCGARLEAAPAAGQGIDRSAIRRLLALSPAQRARLAVREARNLEKVHVRRPSKTAGKAS